MTHSSLSRPRLAHLSHRLGGPACLALVVLLAGCAGGTGPSWPFGRSATPAAAAPVATAVSADPVIAYAATARPGDRAQVPLANGTSAEVRVLRAYVAASGRECREMVVGIGNAERTRLICGGEGGWTDARPLLRGGDTAR